MVEEHCAYDRQERQWCLLGIAQLQMEVCVKHKFVMAHDLRLQQNNKYLAGFSVDMSLKECKTKIRGLAETHGAAVGMQNTMPAPASNIETLQTHCMDRQRADLIGVVTEVSVPSAKVVKAEVWLKDESSKEVLIAGAPFVFKRSRGHLQAPSCNLKIACCRRNPMGRWVRNGMIVKKCLCHSACGSGELAWQGIATAIHGSWYAHFRCVEFASWLFALEDRRW